MQNHIQDKFSEDFFFIHKTEKVSRLKCPEYNSLMSI